VLFRSKGFGVWVKGRVENVIDKVDGVSRDLFNEE
jgi:hypothetical protein